MDDSRQAHVIPMSAVKQAVAVLVGLSVVNGEVVKNLALAGVSRFLLCVDDTPNDVDAWFVTRLLPSDAVGSTDVHVSVRAKRAIEALGGRVGAAGLSVDLVPRDQLVDAVKSLVDANQRVVVSYGRAAPTSPANAPELKALAEHCCCVVSECRGALGLVSLLARESQKQFLFDAVEDEPSFGDDIMVVKLESVDSAAVETAVESDEDDDDDDDDDDDIIDVTPQSSSSNIVPTTNRFCADLAIARSWSKDGTPASLVMVSTDGQRNDVRVVVWPTNNRNDQVFMAGVTPEDSDVVAGWMSSGARLFLQPGVRQSSVNVSLQFDDLLEVHGGSPRRRTAERYADRVLVALRATDEHGGELKQRIVKLGAEAKAAVHAATDAVENAADPAAREAAAKELIAITSKCAAPIQMAERVTHARLLANDTRNACTATFVGGRAAWEVLKLASGRFAPLVGQQMSYDRHELYTPQTSIPAASGSQTWLLVGAGALGAEIVKCVALMGRASGVARLVVVDADTVTHSNLHRQLLFSAEDALQQRGKAEAACACARQLQADNKVAVEFVALQARFELNLLDPAELSRVLCDALGRRDDGTVALDGIVSAVDNLRTRIELDALAHAKCVPLVNGGTHVGVRGSTEIVWPGVTQSLSALAAQLLPPHKKESAEIRFNCTPTSLYNRLEHMVQSARELFEWLFGSKETRVPRIVHDAMQGSGAEVLVSSLAELRAALKTDTADAETIAALGKLLFVTVVAALADKNSATRTLNSTELAEAQRRFGADTANVLKVAGGDQSFDKDKGAHVSWLISTAEALCGVFGVARWSSQSAAEQFVRRVAGSMNFAIITASASVAGDMCALMQSVTTLLAARETAATDRLRAVPLARRSERVIACGRPLDFDAATSSNTRAVPKVDKQSPYLGTVLSARSGEAWVRAIGRGRQFLFFVGAVDHAYDASTVGTLLQTVQACRRKMQLPDSCDRVLALQCNENGDESVVWVSTRF